MRRLLLSLLLLSATAPAIAVQPEVSDSPIVDERPDSRSAERERPQRAERPQRMERAEPRFSRPERAEPRSEAVQSAAQAPQPASEGTGRQEHVERGHRVDRPERQERRQRWGGPATSPEADARASDSGSRWRWRERERETDRGRRQGDLQAAPPSPVLGGSLPGPGVITPPVSNRGESRSSDRLRDRIAAEGWRREWRRDRRYDWRRHRDRDRSRFRVGIYIDPFGWNYRRWQIGWNLYPRFYSSRYWIDEPWHYRLPPAYGPYRWIRYYDDVLLVDMRTGRVVDVIHNFFW